MNRKTHPNPYKVGRPRRNMTDEEREYVILIDKGEIAFNEVKRKFHVSCSTLYRWIDEVRAENNK